MATNKSVEPAKGLHSSADKGILPWKSVNVSLVTHCLNFSLILLAFHSQRLIVSYGTLNSVSAISLYDLSVASASSITASPFSASVFHSCFDSLRSCLLMDE
jgi:hypothetical protein